MDRNMKMKSINLTRSNLRPLRRKKLHQKLQNAKCSGSEKEHFLIFIYSNHLIHTFRYGTVVTHPLSSIVEYTPLWYTVPYRTAGTSYLCRTNYLTWIWLMTPEAMLESRPATLLTPWNKNNYFRPYQLCNLFSWMHGNIYEETT